jgi:hypothetical protein
MIKSFLVYLVAFALLFVVSFFVHTAILNGGDYELRFDILPLYWFFSIISLVLCGLFKVFSNIKKTAEQLGFIYLFTLVVKIAFFVIFFNNSILKLPNLTKTESLNLLIPFFVFLILEIYFITRLLGERNTNSINKKK